MQNKVAIGLASTVLIVVQVVAVLYMFGGMQPPSAEMRAAWDAEVSAGRQDAIETGWVIPIPGCVCHSDDPGLQVQHSGKRLMECKSCHG